jgi:lysophospholipase L1-like esterase
MIRKLACFIALIAGVLPTASAEDLRMVEASTAPVKVAILGDSITHDGRWATRVESALRATPQFAAAEIVNFGLASETVSGLSEDGHAGGKFPRPCLHERLERILDAFNPDLVLACYGMNDGIYLPLEDARMKAYQDGITRLKQAFESRKPARFTSKIVFITPPLHNADKPSDDPNRYDTVLDAQALWLLSKRAEGWNIVDIRPNLKKAVSEAKRANPAFVYAADGVHPGDEGHRFIADAVCQQLWVILMLPGSPQIAGDDAIGILKKRSDLLKLAWLTKTRHTRPGVPAGLPLDQAEAQAATLMEQYRNAIQPRTQP